MLNISYNISPRLNDHLSRIEDLRKRILLTPIAPIKELRLKWEATFDKIHFTLKLDGNPLKRIEMLKLLSATAPKKLTKDQEDVIKYKETLDYIAMNWQGQQNAVNSNAITFLSQQIDCGRMRVPQAGLQHLLDYLQSKSENPIIQAAIVLLELEKMQLFTKHNVSIAHLAADLFLHKYGYNIKGFLAYEETWMKEADRFKENWQRALSATTLTLWLEYFAEKIADNLEKILQKIEKPKIEIMDLKETFWKLNERQRAILGFFDQPEITITNRQVQEKFKISQITASRDLSKLTNLGYLFSHGKGRSVYYTRA